MRNLNAKRTAAELVAALAFVLLCTPALSADKVSAPGTYEGYSEQEYSLIKRKAVYVIMRDGTRIAVDYALPMGLKKNEKVPAIIYQTRYWRSMFLMPGLSETDKALVRHGYAVVLVDVRGTGASFGRWPYPWDEAEIADGADLVDWIVSRPWSNGVVGTYGTSYTGSTAEFLLVNKHPAVKASVVRYALFDSYQDISYPGGVRMDWFLDTWNKADQALDSNDTCRLIEMTGMLPFCIPGTPGVKPAGPPLKRWLLVKQAVKEHVNNGDVYAESLKFAFRDDYSENWEGTIEKISPYFYEQEIEDSGAAIYTITGWMDGAYTDATVNRFLTLDNCRKLLIGPWAHGGRNQISPWSESPEPVFDHTAELLRFFDYHLKGIDNGIMKEPPVFYYTMGEEKWKSAHSWPPQSKTRTYYFKKGHGLGTAKPAGNGEFDPYKVDYTTGTGLNSRYVSLVNLKNVPIRYPDRREEDRKLLVYDTAPLSEDMEVTGHPVIRLYVESSARDGQFFAYLEDVSPGGTVSYITEGMLRGIHRKVENGERLYKEAPGVPWHTFERDDAEPLVSGEVALITFDLQPTSVLFRKGHRIRVAIAGADKDHFNPLPGPEPDLKVYRDAARPSSIDLPVVD